MKMLSSVRNNYYSQVIVGHLKVNLVVYVSSQCLCSKLIDIFLTKSFYYAFQEIKTISAHQGYGYQCHQKNK